MHPTCVQLKVIYFHLFLNYRLQQNGHKYCVLSGHKYAHTVLHMQTNNAEGSDILCSVRINT